MKLKTIKNLKLKGKKVLVRCDFNVPINEKGEIAEDFRIRETLPTINYLIRKKAKIILMSHLADSKEFKDEKEKFTLRPIAKRLERLLRKKIIFLDNYLEKESKEKIEKIKEGEVVLLENLRFNEGEEKNDQEFIENLAKLGDLYINEAFSVCHRNHASIVGLPKYLLSAAGFLLEKEIKILSKILENPSRPMVVIIGGAKISSKSGVISQFLKKTNHLLLGGQLANTILIAKGIIKEKIFTEDQETLRTIKEIDIADPKIHLPLDGLISYENFDENYLRIGAVGSLKKEEKIYDIGPETIKLFSEIIKKGKTIFWSGPLGVFEKKKLEKGTKEIAKAIIKNKKALKVVGGGDTVSAIDKFGFLNKFDHVSTGGGAMLEFLSGKKLPGIEVLK